MLRKHDNAMRRITKKISEVFSFFSFAALVVLTKGDMCDFTHCHLTENSCNK